MRGVHRWIPHGNSRANSAMPASSSASSRRGLAHCAARSAMVALPHASPIMNAVTVTTSANALTPNCSPTMRVHRRSEATPVAPDAARSRLSARAPPLDTVGPSSALGGPPDIESERKEPDQTDDHMHQGQRDRQAGKNHVQQE